MQPTEGITQLLIDWEKGDQQALEKLMPLVYSELRRLASNYLRRERNEHTLQPTAYTCTPPWPCTAAASRHVRAHATCTVTCQESACVSAIPNQPGRHHIPEPRRRCSAAATVAI